MSSSVSLDTSRLKEQCEDVINELQKAFDEESAVRKRLVLLKPEINITGEIKQPKRRHWDAIPGVYKQKYHIERRSLELVRQWQRDIEHGYTHYCNEIARIGHTGLLGTLKDCFKRKYSIILHEFETQEQIAYDRDLFVSLLRVQCAVRKLFGGTETVPKSCPYIDCRELDRHLRGISITAAGEVDVPYVDTQDIIIDRDIGDCADSRYQFFVSGLQCNLLHGHMPPPNMHHDWCDRRLYAHIYDNVKLNSWYYRNRLTMINIKLQQLRIEKVRHFNGKLCKMLELQKRDGILAASHILYKTEGMCGLLGESRYVCPPIQTIVLESQETCLDAINDTLRSFLRKRREESEEKQDINERYLLGQDAEIERDIICNRRNFYISEIETQLRKFEKDRDLLITSLISNIINEQDFHRQTLVDLDEYRHKWPRDGWVSEDILDKKVNALGPWAEDLIHEFLRIAPGECDKLDIRTASRLPDRIRAEELIKALDYEFEVFENSIRPYVTTLDEITSLYTRILSITDKIFSDSQFAKRDPLKTPFSIYKAVRSEYPTATLTRLTLNPLKISLQLDEKGTEIQLTHAVSSSIFRLILLSHLRYQKLGGAQPLDPSRFSLQEEPLRDWEGFARYMSRYRYRVNAYFLEDLVETYLKEPEDGPSLDTMKKMGLSPEQLKGPFSSPEITDPFSKVIERFNGKEDDPVILHLRERYPELVDHFEMEAERQKSSVDNKYTEILKSLESQVKGQPLALQEVAGALAGKPKIENRAFFFVGSNEVERRVLVDTIARLENRSVIEFQITDKDTADSFFSSIDFRTKPRFLLELEKYPAHLSKKDSICVVKDLVFLFDQIEMGHSTLLQSLYTLFNEKKMSLYYRDEESGNGVLVEYCLENCLLISASHDLCQKEVLDSFCRRDNIRQMRAVVMQKLREQKTVYLAHLVEKMQVIPLSINSVRGVII